MDRKTWFIDFARIAGRKNLNAYFVGIIRSIHCCNNDNEIEVMEIRNALDSMDSAFHDESLPWDVLDAKKPSAPTESPKEISHSECTTNPEKVEPLEGLMTEEWVGELDERI